VEHHRGVLQHPVSSLVTASKLDPNERQREFVLKRDGTNVVVNSACTATSGSWKSPFDGATWTQASDIDIDHMVPLKNAWVVSPFSSPSQ
jgi:hypothetical protein